MLKRLSFTNQAEPYLVPPSLQSQGGQSPPGSPRTPLSANLPPSPSRSAPSSPSQQPQGGSYFPLQPIVDRPTLHRSLAALSGLLVCLDEVRDLAARIAKANKKAAKAQRDLASTFGDKVENGARSDIVATALMASSSMFEALSEVDVRYAKFIQKEYENANDLSGKFFKRIAKEEKAFDETIANLDGKVQKANLAYEKTRPRAAAQSPSAAQSAAASHDKYIASLSSLSSTIASVKKGHAESVGEHRQRATREVARIMCGVADASWRSRVEATRRGGEKAGEVVARGVWCESGMPGLAPEEDEPAVAAPAQQQPSQQQAASTRGPRPLYTTTDSAFSSSSQYQQPDPALFRPAPGLPANTYLVQLSAQGAPQTLQAPPPATQTPSSQPPSPRPAPRSPSRNSTFFNDERAPSSQNDSDSVRTATGTGRDSGSTRHTTASASPFSSEDGSQQQQRERDRIIAPKGFVLEDSDPLSPEFECRDRNRYEEKSISPPAQPQGISWARDDRPLERTESSASERNFVARMREKYAEEKERHGGAASGTNGSQRGDESAGWGSASTRSRADEQSERSDAQPPVRSTSRVSNLAQRYSSTLPSSSDSSSAPRPTHRYSHSMQPATSSRPIDISTSTASSSTFARAFDEFGRETSSQFGSSPPLARPSFTERDRPYSRQSLPPPVKGEQDRYSSSPTRMSHGEDEEHSSVCGCEQCSASKYGKSGGSAIDSQRSAGGGKRFSVPAFLGRR